MLRSFCQYSLRDIALKKQFKIDKSYITLQLCEKSFSFLPIFLHSNKFYFLITQDLTSANRISAPSLIKIFITRNQIINSYPAHQYLQCISLSWNPFLFFLSFHSSCTRKKEKKNPLAYQETYKERIPAYKTYSDYTNDISSERRTRVCERVASRSRMKG